MFSWVLPFNLDIQPDFGYVTREGYKRPLLGYGGCSPETKVPCIDLGGLCSEDEACPVQLRQDPGSCAW